MKRLLWVFPLLILGGWLAQRAHAYFYYSGTPPTSAGTNWSQPGSNRTSAYPVFLYTPQSSITYGEVKLTLHLSSGSATADALYFASSDADPSTGTGSFHDAWFYCNGSSFSEVDLSVVYTTSGTLHWNDVADSFGPACSEGSIARIVYRQVSDFAGLHITENAYIDSNLLATYTWDADDPLVPPGGYAGFGGASSVTNVGIGYDDTAPNAVLSSGISSTPYLNHIDLAWSATSDDSGGSGIYRYEILRDGISTGSTVGTTYSDATVSPGTPYTYTLRAVDFEGNTADTSFSAHSSSYVYSGGTFPSAPPDGRRVGVRATGAYWGAGGENVDVLSGNLSFSLPLVSPQSRGSGAGFGLSYNSQNWEHSGSTSTNFGQDVGYGYGWRLMAGALTPVYVSSISSTVDHYLFIDSSGAEYRLDQNSGDIWSSKESLYVEFDASTNRLYFTNGSYWLFDCVTASGEADAGTFYPTLMEDTNGNQILIRYNSGSGASWPNSSARIKEIEDVRAQTSSSVYVSYAFTYNSDTPTPHLTSIGNAIYSGETYSFSMSSSTTITSPWDSTGYSAKVLNSITNSAGLVQSFTYNGAGEMEKMTLPYLGYIKYYYEDHDYTASGHKYRQISARKLSKDTVIETQYTFGHSCSGVTDTEVHGCTTLTDPGGVGAKAWYFNTSGAAEGLTSAYQGIHVPTSDVLIQDEYNWVQDSIGNSYINWVTNKFDPNDADHTYKATAQTVDTHGNVTAVYNLDWDSPTNVYHSETFSYLSSSAYTARHIYNRLSSNSAGVSIFYDQTGLAGLTGLREWDSTLTSTVRGNPTTITSPGGTQTIVYNIAGGVDHSTSNGVTSYVTTGPSTNYAAPQQITVGSMTSTMHYNSFLGLTQTDSPTGASAYFGFNSTTARPTTSTSPFGAVTTTTYNDTTPSTTVPSITTTVNGRWTKVTMDGLGRTVKTEAGDSGGTLSTVDTIYESCGCSPAGKMTQTSMPYGPSGSPVWTKYTYDGVGRTVSVEAPDTHSVTHYVYQKNTVQVVDPTGKWKLYITDVLGQLVQVREPDPGGGSSPANDYVTNYSYDWYGHLTGVSMPRSTGTQTRLFNFTGAALLSASTNPESGTVTYTYNSDNTVATKTDAKRQQTQYTYDSLKRVTQVQRGSMSALSSPSPLVTGQSVANPRNDFTGWVGMRVFVGSTPMVVSSLGRWMISGNTGTHTVKLVDEASGLDVPGASVSVSMSGHTAGTFVYVNLSSPVTLAANAAYYLVTLETSGQDSWYDDYATTVSTTSDAGVTQAVYRDTSWSDPAWHPVGTIGHAYAPLSLTYSLGGSTGSFAEAACQRENYTYGTTGYALGRLETVQYWGGGGTLNINGVAGCVNQITETYTYSIEGATLSKAVKLERPGTTSGTWTTKFTQTASYTYDNEGRIATQQYPSYYSGGSWVTGPHLGNTFDSMGRLQKLTDLAASTDIISDAQYNAADQLKQTTGGSGVPSESRTFNDLGQLTDLQSGSLHMQYTFDSTQNNGKIKTEKDVVSGEEITYGYDSLNRLASATSSDTPGWGQDYGYDGFGNLTTQSVNKGTAPSLSVSYNYATNRRSGDSADANGNLSYDANSDVLGYDIENRLASSNGAAGYPYVTMNYYGYAPGNKRVWRCASGVGHTDCNSLDEFTFYGITGQKLVTNDLATNTGSTFYYFGGKMIKNTAGYLTRDMRGSSGKFFPYGQERPSATTNDKEKFATYYRDSETGLDYAQNRYHSPGDGRFLTPDPSHSANPNNPNSWNQYAYTGGDPANRTDPSGNEYFVCDGEAGCADICQMYNPMMAMGYNFYWFWDVDPGILEEKCAPPPDPPCDVCQFDKKKTPKKSKQQRFVDWLPVAWASLKDFSPVEGSLCDQDLVAVGLTVETIHKDVGDGVDPPLLMLADATLNPALLADMNARGADLAAPKQKDESRKFIVYNANQYQGGSYGLLLGSLLHELIHTLDIGHVTIANDLNRVTGGKKVNLPTDLAGNLEKSTPISQRLADDCFKGAAAP